MATWKGLSSSLIVQIVTHLSMKKSLSLKRKSFLVSEVMLEKPLWGGGGWIPPSPSRNKVNIDLIICHCINFVVSCSFCLSQSKSNHKITRLARSTIFLQEVNVLIVLFRMMLKHISNAVTFLYLILVTWICTDGHLFFTTGKSSDV